MDEALLAKRRKIKSEEQEKGPELVVKTFNTEHKRLRAASPHYASFCSLLTASGIRVFRFIGTLFSSNWKGPEPCYCRILFFTIMANWSLLQSAYLKMISSSQEHKFVTYTGEVPQPNMTCSQLPEVDGVTTIYVLPSAPPPPLISEEEEAAQEEDIEKVIEDQTQAEEVSTDKTLRPRIRTVTPEVF